jgi:nitroreductase
MPAPSDSRSSIDHEVLDRASVDGLLSTTRAVRRRLDCSRPVEREVILECLRLAQQAPTGSNMQIWRWLVVTDADMRRALAEIYASGQPLIDRSRAAMAADDHQTQRVYDSVDYLVQHLHEVPAMVIPCVTAARWPDMDSCTLASIYGSIFPAVWSFQLALRSRGLGSVLTTLHLLKEQEAADLLGIPEGIMQVGLLPVGYTKGTDFKPVSRPPIESITHWNRWSG